MCSSHPSTCLSPTPPPLPPSPPLPFWLFRFHHCARATSTLPANSTTLCNTAPHWPRPLPRSPELHLVKVKHFNRGETCKKTNKYYQQFSRATPEVERVSFSRLYRFFATHRETLVAIFLIIKFWRNRAPPPSPSPQPHRGSKCQGGWQLIRSRTGSDCVNSCRKKEANEAREKESSGTKWKTSWWSFEWNAPINQLQATAIPRGVPYLSVRLSKSIVDWSAEFNWEPLPRVTLFYAIRFMLIKVHSKSFAAFRRGHTCWRCNNFMLTNFARNLHWAIINLGQLMECTKLNDEREGKNSE